MDMILNLEHLEAKLQSLVEDQLVGILPGLKVEDRMIHRLASALKQNIVQQKDEGAIAPNVFTLIVATDSSPMWKEQATQDALRNIIMKAGKDAGLKFVTPPTISISVDDTYAPGEVSVMASHKLEPVADTRGMQTTSNDHPEVGESIPDNAFLIIEGVKVHPLTQTVVNIGRRLENNLVIDDPRVSRNHAQLRAIKGRFVLFDLNSTGGTFVNGQRTSQTVLYPGDVISLAGVALIFGQDNPPPRPDLAEISRLDEDAVTSERPTATIHQQTVDIKTDRLDKNKLYK